MSEEIKKKETLSKEEKSELVNETTDLEEKQRVDHLKDL